MSPAEIQAMWILGLLTIEQVDAIATEWLEAGWDSPAIRELAWKQSTWRETTGVFAQAIVDLGLPPMSVPEAQMLLTLHTAQEVLADRLAPLDSAAKIYWNYWESWGRESIPAFVWELYGLLLSSDPDEDCLMPLDEIDAGIRSILATLVAVER
ncbi:MAG TPA: hypothetical protein V6D47_17620 [Oscillatoriaceae cyanobacterium]